MPVLTVFSRAISCFSRPSDFTSSTLRSVSVVDPASSAVCVTIARCCVLMRRLMKNISVPREGASSRYAVPSDQCTVKA